MAPGKQQHAVQGQLYIRPDELPRSPGHVFYDLLHKILISHKFDAFVEELCAPFYAPERGRPPIPPGRYFRMYLIAYYEGISSERNLVWRCRDSLSLREFLLLDYGESIPDHSSLSRIRSRLPLDVHHKVMQWGLGILKHNKLLEGKRISVDASTMEANAAMRNIVHKHSRKSYDEILTDMCKESGIPTPTRADMIKIDKKRKDKKVSNKEWESGSDKDARIARMKDKTTKMAYKPEHAVDLDTGEIVERSFQHVLDRGGQRRSHLRGRENVEKAYLLAVCAHNFGLIMQKITTKGTPKGLGGGGMHMACLWLQEMAYIVCYFDMCKTSDCSPNWVISLIVVIKF